MANINTADIGFEKEIWKAADLLRGNLDASEYKSVVLGLIFLKYLSDRFEAKYSELLAEGEGFEEDKDEYTSENIFYVPQDARWSVIADAAHSSEIGMVIDNAMRQIEKENIRLKKVSCLRISHAQSWINAVWAMWWTSSPIFKCASRVIRRIS